MTITFDSYSEENDDGNACVLSRIGKVGGTSFNAGATAPLVRMVFFLKGKGTPTGTIIAKLYAHTGTYGSSGVATGDALDTSINSFDVATISTASYEPYTFNFSGSVQLTAGTKYVAVVYITGSLNVSNCVWLMQDGSTLGHAGCFVGDDALGTGWYADNSFDVPFYVYGNIVVPNVGDGGGGGMRHVEVVAKNDTVRWSEKEAARQITRLNPQSTVVRKAAIPHTKRLIRKSYGA